MRRAGKASPEAISAERTRSRASETALSGRPTMLKAGMPGATCTCTSTGADLDALERNRGDALDHVCPASGLFAGQSSNLTSSYRKFSWRGIYVVDVPHVNA